jgi:toxin ParE1/3/4
MRKVRLHARAESDLVDIWLYSFREWGELQADEYLDELNAAVISLSSNPERGIRRDGVRAGYRTLFVKHHAIYCKLSSGSVEIVRVLHEQMDPDRHLDPTERP